MNTETQTQTRRFDCTCNGCRDYPTRPSQVWHHSQIAEKEKGTYYFTPQAMRFFSSRISDFKGVLRNGDAIESLSVIVSSRYGYEGAVREYETVILCPYGTIHREGAKYDTLKKARKEWDYAIAHFAPCSCHGCILNREGRGLRA